MKSLFRKPCAYELPYPIPYAVGPSAQGEGWISFTYRGSTTTRTVIGIGVGVGFVFLMIVVPWGISSGFGRSIPLRGYSMPLWVPTLFMFLFGAWLVWALFRYRRREEIRVSIRDGLVRYSIERDGPGPFGPGRILVVASRTFQATGSSAKLISPSREVWLVVFAGGERYGIVGAFMQVESAQYYAEMIAQVTRLSIDKKVPEELQVVQGDLKVGANDEQALEVRVCEIPIYR